MKYRLWVGDSAPLETRHAHMETESTTSYVYPHGTKPAKGRRRRNRRVVNDNRLRFFMSFDDPPPGDIFGVHPVRIEVLTNRGRCSYQYQHTEARVLLDFGDFSDWVGGDIVVEAIPTSGHTPIGTFTFY